MHAAHHLLARVQPEAKHLPRVRPRAVVLGVLLHLDADESLNGQPHDDGLDSTCLSDAWRCYYQEAFRNTAKR